MFMNFTFDWDLKYKWLHLQFFIFKYFEQRRVQANSLFKLSETAFEVVNEASELACVKIITIILKELVKLVRFQCQSQ